MGQQKLRKVRYTNSNLKKLNSEPRQTPPGTWDSYPKVTNYQTKPQIAANRKKTPAQTVHKKFERPKAVLAPKPLKPTKARNQDSKSVESSILIRSLPTYSELEFKAHSKANPVTSKAIKLDNYPKSSELGTKKTKEDPHKNLPKIPKRLYYRRDDPKIITNVKKNPIVKAPLSQSVSTPSKVYRVEINRRELINKSKKSAAKHKAPDALKAKPKIISRDQNIDPNKYKNTGNIPKSKSYDQQGIGYLINSSQDQWAFDPSEASYSLPKLPGKLRSILKSSMNYPQIKKLDEDSLQQLTEGKGPADECICNLLSTTESKGRGIKASIKRAFASLSGGKKRGGGGQNSVDIPLVFAQDGKGGMYSTKEVLKRKSPCGKCGCDKGPVVLKHSYANIRITCPDLSSICSCPEDCIPDKDRYNGKIKVTVERMAVNSDDSELSLHKRIQQPAIPEPMMGAAMESICPLLAPGGDAQPANLRCLVCGATEHLRLISEDHTDLVLQTQFGFTEPPTGFICESCKNYLKITVGFRALVEASRSRVEKSKERRRITSSTNTTISAAPTLGQTNLASPDQELTSLPQTPVKYPKKRQRQVINAKKSSTVVRKRVITVCAQCGHKYPAMVKLDSVLQFVCSRCNQKNQIVEKNNTLQNQKRFSLKGKTRLKCLSKTPQQAKPILSSTTRRFSLKGKTRLNCLSKTPQQAKPILSSKTRLRNSKLCHKEINPLTTNLRQVHRGGSNLAWHKTYTDNLAGHSNKYGYLEQHIKTNKRVLLVPLNEKPLQQTKNIWR